MLLFMDRVSLSRLCFIVGITMQTLCEKSTVRDFRTVQNPNEDKLIINELLYAFLAERITFESLSKSLDALFISQ